MITAVQTTRACLLAAAAWVCAVSVLRAQAPGDVDTSFDAVATSAVHALVIQSDGKIVLGGEFNVVDGYYSYQIARLNTDGTLDFTFNASTSDGEDPTVNALALQPDGKIILGGGFGTVNGFSHNGIARLYPDGSVDNTFNPGTDNYVDAVAIQSDGKILIGSTFFTEVNGYAREGIARLNADGTLDTAFTADVTADPAQGVASLAVQPDGKILLAGGFYEVNGIEANGVARLNADGSLDHSFYASVQGGSVSSVVVQPDGKIIVTGDFYDVDGFECDNIARLNADGSLDTGFSAGTDNSVNTAVVQANGKVIIGGNFTQVNSVALTGLARLNADGSTDGGFVAGAYYTYTSPYYGNVIALALQANQEIVVGGFFNVVDNSEYNNIARLYGDSTASPPPVITSASAATGQVGQAFSYQIAATNAPTVFTATGLPPGLQVNPQTGLIGGVPATAGTYPISLSATNGNASGTAGLTVTIAPAGAFLPVVTLVATTPEVMVGSGGMGDFTVSLSAPQTTDIVIHYTIKGSAANGTDYVLLSGTKKIKAGKTSKPIKIIPLGDLGGASKKVVKLTLDPGTAYILGSTLPVKVKILHGD